jgi:hypothetical protein
MKPELKITAKHIRKQLKDDLIGKDSYRGITLTYAWLANQFGHFALGFIPTILVYAICRRFLGYSHASSAEGAAGFIAVVCLGLEIWNFLGPIRTMQKSTNRWLYISNKTTYTFTPPWLNVGFDTLTDVLYFWLGCCFASEFLMHSVYKLIILGVLLFILFFCFKCWYKVKMYLQAAHFPFQFRLSQWDYNIALKDKALIKALSKEDSNYHVLICGHNKCGRTSLGVAMATEFALKKKPALYTTAMKILPQFFPDAEDSFDGRNQMWEWEDASLLVIDDINPSNPVFHEVISTDLFLQCLDTNTKNNELNRHRLKTKKVIWILGVGKDGNHFAQSWSECLLKIGIAEKDIHVISLSEMN